MREIRTSSSSPTSRRIGGGSETLLPSLRPRSAWFLKLLSLAFVGPAVLRLLGADVTAAGMILLGIALLWVAAELIGRGLTAQAELTGRTLAVAPDMPYKLAGSLTAGAAAAAFSIGGANDGLLMGALFGGLVYLGCRMAYGADPKTDRSMLEQAAKRANMAPADVLAALDEASRKIRDIEIAAAGIKSRELSERLQSITTQARAVLAQIERDPRDISRARRFLVTYLDGTRDVVEKYAGQQHDLASTPLADNFRRVLDTIEQVFIEQEEVLKRDEHLDLEVKLDVLESQLRREGVH